MTVCVKRRARAPARISCTSCPTAARRPRGDGWSGRGRGGVYVAHLRSPLPLHEAQSRRRGTHSAHFAVSERPGDRPRAFHAPGLHRCLHRLHAPGCVGNIHYLGEREPPDVEAIAIVTLYAACRNLTQKPAASTAVASPGIERAPATAGDERTCGNASPFFFARIGRLYTNLYTAGPGFGTRG